MMKLKALLLAGGIFAVAGTQAAHAVPTLQYAVYIDGTAVAFGPGATSTTGSIKTGGSAPPYFTTLSENVVGTSVTGSQLLINQTAISAGSFLGTHSLEVIVAQTGLTSATGNFNIANLIGLDESTGGPVAASVRDFIDPNNGGFNAAGNVAVGEAVLLSSFTGTSGVNSNNGAPVRAANVGNALFSETEDLNATFAAGQTLGVTIQFAPTANPPTPVPEPASLALVGSALFGLGMIRRRRNRS